MARNRRKLVRWAKRSVERSVGGIIHDLPGKFQLAETDANAGIVIPCGAELDVLRLFIVAEPDLCGLVEATDDVIKIIHVFRV